MRNSIFLILACVIFGVSAAAQTKNNQNVAEKAVNVSLEADKISLQPKQRTLLQIKITPPATIDDNGNIDFPKSVNLPANETAPYKSENWKILKGGGTLTNPGLDNSSTTRHYLAPPKAVGNGDVEISVDLIPMNPDLPKVVLLKALHVGEKNDWFAKVEGTIVYSEMRTYSSYEKEENGDYQKHNSTERTVANYKVTKTEKMLRHDGFVSNIEPSDLITTGSVSYNYINKSQDYDASNKKMTNYSETTTGGGQISSGHLQIDYADQGDRLRVVEFSADAEVPGSSQMVIISSDGTTTDSRCGIGLITGDAGCVFRFSNLVGASAKKPDLPPEILALTEDEGWKGTLNITGSYDEGRYTVTYTGRRAPKSDQINESSDRKTRTETHVETVSFYVTVTLVDKVDTVNK